MDAETEDKTLHTRAKGTAGELASRFHATLSPHSTEDEHSRDPSPLNHQDDYRFPSGSFLKSSQSTEYAFRETKLKQKVKGSVKSK